MRTFFKLTLTGLLCTIGTAAQAQLVQNGSFETGDFAGWTRSGDTLLTSVTVPTLGAPDGDRYAVLASFGTTGTISQKIPTDIGRNYIYSFSLANSVGITTLGQQSSFLFAAGGNPLVSLTNPTGFQFTPFSGTFTASSTETEIAFTARHDPGAFRLDAISVNGARVGAVPEPATWAMMIGGFGTVGTALRRRKALMRRTYA
jgi:hypothetical protein